MKRSRAQKKWIFAYVFARFSSLHATYPAIDVKLTTIIATAFIITAPSLSPCVLFRFVAVTRRVCHQLYSLFVLLCHLLLLVLSLCVLGSCVCLSLTAASFFLNLIDVVKLDMNGRDAHKPVNHRHKDGEN